MTCKCACTCPPEVGDRIQYKLDPNSSYPNTRINGGLILTLQYLSDFHAVYRWEGQPNPRTMVVPWGEVHMTRDEFDEKIERVPGQ